MGKTGGAFPKTLVLVPPKNVSYQTQSVLIPCPPHRIAPLSEYGPVYHKTEADRMVCLKQQVIIPKTLQIPDSGHQEKDVPLVNKKNIEKLCPKNNLGSYSSFLFRYKAPFTGVLYPGDHQSLRPGSDEVGGLDEPEISSYKDTAEPCLRPSTKGMVTSHLRGKKLNRATIRTIYDPDHCYEVATTKRQSAILNPVSRDQPWKRLNSDNWDKHNLGFNEQAKPKVAFQHQPNTQLKTEDQPTHLLNGHPKIPARSPETKAKKQLNKRSWAKLFHCCDHPVIIPVSNQHQAPVALDLVSEDSLPLNHTYMWDMSEAPMHMVCGCQRKSQPFIFPQSRTPPCSICSSRSQLMKPSSDCWTMVTLPMLEHHSKAPLHPNAQDIPVPKKSALHLSGVPKSPYYQARHTQISDHRDKEHHQVQTEQNRGIPRYLNDINPYTTEGLTHTTKCVDDIISSIRKEKIKSDFSNPVHLRQMKECPRYGCWPCQHMPDNDSSCLGGSSWAPNDSPDIDKGVTVTAPLPGPENKNVRFLLDLLRSKASPSSKAPDALSSKLRHICLPPAFPSRCHSDSVPLDPLRPKLTWLDFIRQKHHQQKEERTSPSQDLYWREIPFTNKNIINEMPVKQNTCPMSLLKKFERKINN